MGGASVSGSSQRPRRPAGDLEAEVLSALWAAAGPLSVGEVQDALGGGLAHTTVQTILVRLRGKGAVEREWDGRRHRYRPVLAEEDLTARQMRRLLDNEDDRASVLQRFVSELRPEDEAALQAALGRVRHRRNEAG